MSKNEIYKKAKELAEYYAQFPEWYWKGGLHDAKLLSLKPIEIEPDYEKGTYNCLEICLDADGALFEEDVTRILLYNYKIERLPAIVNAEDAKWWYGDELTKTDDGKYKLDITIVDRKNNKHIFTMIFKTAEVERR